MTTCTVAQKGGPINQILLQGCVLCHHRESHHAGSEYQTPGTSGKSIKQRSLLVVCELMQFLVKMKDRDEMRCWSSQTPNDKSDLT
jgi:hypothetical protein